MGETLRKRLAQKTLEAADRLDLPSVLAPDIPRMELLGNRAFYMDRHRGVLGYSTEAVDINGGVRWWCGSRDETCNYRP